MKPEVLSFYDTAPLTVRARVWARWISCPFGAVAARIPEQGRVLEVGCGYGQFSCHLALASRERDVTGIDIDEQKVVHAKFAARRARERGLRCEFQLSPPGEIPEGPWDAIVIVDVLYLLDPDAQEGVLHSCAQELAPGGVLAVKEMALTPRWKVRWNAVQETAAVRVLRITAGESLTFLAPDELAAWMAADGLAVEHLPLDAGYPHPHHLITGRRPDG